jgi:glycosyltransferase involved in cell wall biosynthesis
MRVLLVQESFAPAVGGAELHVLQLARALRRAGHRCEVACATPGPPEVDGFRVWRSPIFAHQGRMWPVAALVGVPGLIARILKADVVHGHCTSMMSAMSAAVCRLVGKRFVVTLHGYGTLDSSVKDSRAAQRWRRMSMRGAAAVIGTTDEMMAIGLRFAPAERVVKITNGVDTRAFAFEPIPERDELRLLTLRRLVPKNGVQYVIEAMPGIVRRAAGAVRLRVCGSGPLEEPLRARVAELGLADVVTFSGTIDNDEVAAVIHDSDVAVFASSAEGFSLAALEVMSCGRLVVASSVGGFPEMLGGLGERGVLVDLMNTADSDYEAPSTLDEATIDRLAEAVWTAGADREGMRKTATAASEWVRERLDWDRIAADVARTYVAG